MKFFIYLYIIFGIIFFLVGFRGFTKNAFDNIGMHYEVVSQYKSGHIQNNTLFIETSGTDCSRESRKCSDRYSLYLKSDFSNKLQSYKFEKITKNDFDGSILSSNNVHIRSFYDDRIICLEKNRAENCYVNSDEYINYIINNKINNSYSYSDGIYYSITDNDNKVEKHIILEYRNNYRNEQSNIKLYITIPFTVALDVVSAPVQVMIKVIYVLFSPGISAR